MKGTSSRLRLADLKQVYCLLGECCELGADPQIWRCHMLTQFNQILGSVGAVVVDAAVVVTAQGSTLRPHIAFSPGRYTASEIELLTRCLREMPIEHNPLIDVLFNLGHDRAAMAVHRSGSVGRREWDRCGLKTGYFDQLGWDDCMSGIVRSSEGLRVFTLTRERKDANFSAREAAMLNLFLREMSTISAQRLAPMSDGSLLMLPARLRDVLIALAEGEGEKQIAQRLTISRNTVHEYVRRLFDRYGVSSRSELLVRAARQLHAFSLAAPLSEAECLCYKRDR